MSNTIIKSVHARHLIDCKLRGLVEVDIITDSGSLGRAAAPTGTSVGSGEAFVMRDDPPARFLGTSVFKAVDIVNNIIAPAIIGMDASDQISIDNFLLELDGTPLKTKLGGNCIYSVSVACAAASASAQNIPLYQYWAQGQIETLPLPVCNMFNGGKYGNINMAFQEFGVIPYKAGDMQEAVEILITMFNEVGKLVQKKQNGVAPYIANYFGHVPISDDPIEHFEIISEAAANLGYTDKICYSTDCAAGEFYNKNNMTYSFKGKEVTTEELIDYVKRMTELFPFYNVEDILEDNDFNGFAGAAKTIKRTHLIGDDLICTDVSRLKKALDLGACEGLIFKPNQIGTISQSFDTFNYAKEKDLIVIPSVRAGGTLEDPVKDMAIALDVSVLKCGAPRSGERVSCLQTLLRASDLFPNAKLHEIKLKL